MASKNKKQAKGREAQLVTLDLHGYTTDRVVDAVDRFLVDAQRKHLARVRIITGKGTGAVRKVALDWLKRGGFPYSQENEGSYVVFIDD
ncbi:MAG: Smr/MutS family protein [Bdellovibrionales bacterium]|jgi:DNA mismatch repair protein MutS2|nr:Smr/MutS family protein [Bdellovibrionales bacterium]